MQPKTNCLDSNQVDEPTVATQDHDVAGLENKSATEPTPEPTVATQAASQAGESSTATQGFGMAGLAPEPTVATQDSQLIKEAKETTETKDAKDANDAKNGINKCPSCSSSDIELNINTGMLRCNFCRSEWSEQADSLDYDIASLQGVIVGEGVADIAADADDIITLKCSACGAEVVIDTKEAPQARCHWCRNMLSLNQQVPNGAVPDAVLPFKLSKDQAKQHIEKFVRKRSFFAHPQFRAEFSSENIMGVYLPYMVIDINAHASFQGQGEHLVRRYTVGSNDKKEIRYDADLYNVGRDFDVLIDDLTIEAAADKLNQAASLNSNNVINAVLPYPLKETVRFNANYLHGFTSEKRDVNRDQVNALVNAQVRDIARWQAKRTLQHYDRGVRWDTESLDIKGQLWKTVYLPVWLYSYLQVKPSGKKFLHYVATNAVTGETMGSVPIHMPKLLAVSAVVEVIGCIVGIGLAIAMTVTG